jgi:hypothetical protein
MSIHKILSPILFILILGLALPSFGQFGQPKGDDNKSDFKSQKRVYVGGGLGLGISSYSTSIMVAPVIGYRLTPDIDIGGRVSYSFNSYAASYYGAKFTTNNVGFGPFITYYLFFFSDLFIHAEYEALNYDKYLYLNPINNEVEKERAWVSSLFLGGGYRQWIGANAFVGISVLFNLLDSYESPYANPIFRIGFGVGI